MASGTINAPSSWITIGNETYLNVNALLSPAFLSVLLSSNVKPTIKTVATAGNKESHSFQDNLKQFILRSEKATTIRYNFNEADFDSGKKLTITSGGFLKLSGLDFTNKTIYFETDRNNIDVEIIELY